MKVVAGGRTNHASKGFSGHACSAANAGATAVPGSQWNAPGQTDDELPRGLATEMSYPTAPTSSTHRVQVAAGRQPPRESDAGPLPNQRRTGSVGGPVRLRRLAPTVANQTQRGHEHTPRPAPRHRQRRCVTRGAV